MLEMGKAATHRGWGWPFSAALSAEFRIGQERGAATADRIRQRLRGEVGADPELEQRMRQHRRPPRHIAHGDVLVPQPRGGA